MPLAVPQRFFKINETYLHFNVFPMLCFLSEKAKKLPICSNIIKHKKAFKIGWKNLKLEEEENCYLAKTICRRRNSFDVLIRFWIEK